MVKLRWLKSMTAIICSVLLGVLIGIYRPEWGTLLSSIGDVYISFLMMCVSPIVVTAISGALAKLLSGRDAGNVLKRAVLYFGSAMAGVSIVLIIVGSIVRPGDLSNESRMAFGDILVHLLQVADTQADTVQIGALLSEIIPSNVFAAFVSGNTIQILFFSILLGVLLGYSQSPVKAWAISLLELVFDLFQSAISWSMYALPFALLCIVAGQLARTGSGVIFAMLKFILIIGISAIVIICVCMLLISIKRRMSLRQLLATLRPTLVVAFATSNGVAAMPLLLKALTEEWRLNATTVNLVVPLGILMSRIGLVMLSTLGLIFTAQLYFVPVTFGTAMIIVFGAILASVTTAGAPGVVSLGAVGLVADYLRLPYGATVPLLLAILPIVDPILTVVNVMINSLAGVVIAGKADDQQQSEHALVPDAAEVIA